MNVGRIARRRLFSSLVHEGPPMRAWIPLRMAFGDLPGSLRLAVG